VNITDLIEFGDDISFVTAKVGNGVSVIRGYYGTTAQDHDSGDVGVLNPRWTRKRVANTIRDSFTFLEENGLPLVFTETAIDPVADPIESYSMVLPVPSGARRVFTVSYGTHVIPNMVPVNNLSLADGYPSESVVRLPGFARRFAGPYTITYQLPYRWSTFPDPPVEESTIEIPEGAELLPPMYAVWKLTSDREVSRSQIDRSEEATNSQRDTGPALVRLKQQEFYGALDAARRPTVQPHSRPYVSNPTWTGMRRPPI
jgi:hypothetical protein